MIVDPPRRHEYHLFAGCRVELPDTTLAGVLAARSRTRSLIDYIDIPRS